MEPEDAKTGHGYQKAIMFISLQLLLDFISPEKLSLISVFEDKLNK